MAVLEDGKTYVGYKTSAIVSKRKARLLRAIGGGGKGAVIVGEAAQLRTHDVAVPIAHLQPVPLAHPQHSAPQPT